MTLHPPFAISSRLLPGLCIEGAWLSLERVARQENGRDRATFILDLLNGTSYTDSQLQSGVGGFRSPVEAFESFLGFLSACAESLSYGNPPGENADLFPRHIGEWACEHNDEIAGLTCDLQIGDSDCVNINLIEW